jgi:CheY-like chemotaxis protein
MQIGVETSRAVENKRIFVVDGDEITRAALQFMLHDENETHELAGLQEAFAKGTEWKPDLLLLGLAVVLAEGVSVLGEIAARLPGTRIMLVAEAGQDGLAQSYLKSGAHGVIVKPLTVESVRRKVDMLLGRLRLPVVQLEVMTTGTIAPTPAAKVPQTGRLDPRRSCKPP